MSLKAIGFVALILAWQEVAKPLGTALPCIYAWGQNEEFAITKSWIANTENLTIVIVDITVGEFQFLFNTLNAILLRHIYKHHDPAGPLWDLW